jgi:HEAT repeat protein
VRPLLALIQNEPDEVVKRNALEKLVSLVGPEDAAVAAQVKPLLQNDDPDTVRLAAYVLANIGGASAIPALPVLRDALKDEDPEAQELAAAGLAAVGPEAAPAIPELARALAEAKSAAVRRNSALALGKIGPNARAAVPALGRALDPKEEFAVRMQAAEALHHISYPGNEQAIPAILDVIQKDADARVRHRCVWALFDVRDVERHGIVAPLAKVLEETEPTTVFVRYDAARLLAFRLRERAPDKVVDTLLDMLKNRDLIVFRGTDAKVVGAGSEASAGQSAVRENQGGDGRYMAAEAIQHLGAKAKSRKDVMDALKAATTDSDKMLRDAAQKALDALR